MSQLSNESRLFCLKKSIDKQLFKKIIKKNLTNYFVSSKSCSTFAPAFREGASSLKYAKKFFQKHFVRLKKCCTFAPAFKKGAKFKNRLKKFFKKVLVEWKKGCTFAPAFKTSERRKRLNFFLKKIWSIKKKVIPLHPQTKRQVH